MADQQSSAPKTFYGSTGLPCRNCNQPHQEYSVDSKLWNLVMRPDGRETEYEYLCLKCFHRRIAARVELLVLSSCRMCRQERRIFAFSKARVEILESALREISERANGGYLGRQWVWRTAQRALSNVPNFMTIKTEQDDFVKNCKP